MLGRIEIRQVHQGFSLRRRTWCKPKWYGKVPDSYADGDDYYEGWDDDPIYRIVYATANAAQEDAKRILREEEIEKRRKRAEGLQAAEWADKGVLVGYVGGWE